DPLSLVNRPTSSLSEFKVNTKLFACSSSKLRLSPGSNDAGRICLRHWSPPWPYTYNTSPSPSAFVFCNMSAPQRRFGVFQRPVQMPRKPLYFLGILV